MKVGREGGGKPPRRSLSVCASTICSFLVSCMIAVLGSVYTARSCIYIGNLTVESNKVDLVVSLFYPS